MWAERLCCVPIFCNNNNSNSNVYQQSLGVSTVNVITYPGDNEGQVTSTALLHQNSAAAAAASDNFRSPSVYDNDKIDHSPLPATDQSETTSRTETLPSSPPRKELQVNNDTTATPSDNQTNPENENAECRPDLERLGTPSTSMDARDPVTTQLNTTTDRRQNGGPMLRRQPFNIRGLNRVVM